MKKLIFLSSIAITTLTFAKSSDEGGSASLRPGFGVATFGGVANTQAVSGMFQIHPAHTLQVTFGINNSAATTLGGGLIYRFRCCSSQGAGFHAGLGSTIGANASTFTFNVFPLAGFHFNLGASPNIWVHVDAGATLTITPAPINFTFMPMSAMWGTSIHYMF